jgi:hypothetical protein
MGVSSKPIEPRDDVALSRIGVPIRIKDVDRLTLSACTIRASL